MNPSEMSEAVNATARTKALDDAIAAIDSTFLAMINAYLAVVGLMVVYSIALPAPPGKPTSDDLSEWWG